MRNVNTPPRRKSIINVFTTPPLRRSLFSRNKKQSPSPFENKASATESDDDSDDENALTATGDISPSYPYFVPGAAGALSPKPKSRHGAPNSTLKAQLQLQRPRPPARRVGSVGTDTYKFRTLTLKGRPSPAATPGKDTSSNATKQKPTPQAAPSMISPPAVLSTPGRHPGDESVSSISSFCGSIGSIEDEDSKMSTPQSRFQAFMRSRDLTRSPQKVSAPGAGKLDRNAFAEAATSALRREVAQPRPNTRPLRGNARLPARLPIPTWGTMEVDD